jgi:thiol:disulfide interchange protein
MVSTLLVELAIVIGLWTWACWSQLKKGQISLIAILLLMVLVALACMITIRHHRWTDRNLPPTQQAPRNK